MLLLIQFLFGLLFTLQVKRYIDLYSATSVIGLPIEDLNHVSELYSQAQTNWSDTVSSSYLPMGTPDRIQDSEESPFQQQIDAYSDFLESVAKLARSAWTEFDGPLMGVGLSCMLVSLAIHLLAIRRLNILCKPYQNALSILGNYFSLVSALLLVAIRAASFLSNSYICKLKTTMHTVLSISFTILIAFNYYECHSVAEGSVANFLLATAGIIRLQRSISEWKLPTNVSISSMQIDVSDFHILYFCDICFLQELFFLLLSTIIRFGIEIGMSKESSASTFLFTFSKNFFGINGGDPLLTVLTDIFPIILLFVLAIMFYKFISGICCWPHFRYILYFGTVCSYLLIALHWASESNLMPISLFVQYTGRNFAPQVVYAIGFGLLVLSVLSRFLDSSRVTPIARMTVLSLALVSSWSPTILILLGRQGPFAVLIFISGGILYLKF